MVIGSRQKLQAEGDNEIQVNIDSKTVERVDNTKSFGLIIDDRLSCREKSSSYAIYRFSQG